MNAGSSKGFEVKEFVGANDYDNMRTQKQMTLNREFQDFFGSYQKKLDDSLNELDKLAQQSRSHLAHRHLCQEPHKPKI